MPERTTADVLRGSVPILRQRGRTRSGYYIDSGDGKVCAVAALVISAGHDPKDHDEVGDRVTEATGPLAEAIVALSRHLNLQPTQGETGNTSSVLTHNARIANWSDARRCDDVVTDAILETAEALDGKRPSAPEAAQ